MPGPQWNLPNVLSEPERYLAPITHEANYFLPRMMHHEFSAPGYASLMTKVFVKIHDHR